MTSDTILVEGSMFSFSCVKRGGNMVAYSLAKFARILGRICIG